MPWTDEYKSGDRVRFIVAEHRDFGDTGSIVEIDGDIDSIWVKWDSDGQELWVHGPEEIEKVVPDHPYIVPVGMLQMFPFGGMWNQKEAPDDLTERLAIAFLKERGYNVSKGEVK